MHVSTSALASSGSDQQQWIRTPRASASPPVDRGIHSALAAAAAAFAERKRVRIDN